MARPEEGSYGEAMSARDFNSQPQGTHLPAGLVPSSVEEDVRSAIWKQIVLGHADEATLAFDIADQFSDGPAPVDEDGVRAAVHHLVAVRRGQQETFGEVVTNLDSAFATLREPGVIAEQVFSCCNTCGFDEIRGVSDGPHWAGFVFFHLQDAEELVETGETYLSYGMFWSHYKTRMEYDAMSEDARSAYCEERTRDLVRLVVVPTLREYGLEVDWNEDLNTRILLRGAEFYRPIP